MKQIVAGLLTALALLSGIVVYAQATQVITADMRLTWDQAAANLAEAQSMRYTAYVDGAATGTIVVATCQGSVSPFKCGIANPATAVGAHTVAVASQLPLTGGGFTPESRSVVCSFRVVVPSAAPTNLQFVRLVLGALGLVDAVSA